MSLTSRMIRLVPSADWRIFAIDTFSRSTALTPSSALARADPANSFACSAFRAASSIPFEAASIDSRVSWTEEACREAPVATACDDDTICPAAPDTWLAASVTWASALWSASAVRFTASFART